MRRYLDPNQLNVAPGAARHLPLVWMLLAASATVLGLSLYPLWHELGLLNQVKAQQAALTLSMRKDAVAQRKQLADQGSSDALERDKIKAQLQESVHMSWDGIFDALEVAADTVHAGVSILSLAPARVHGTATQLNISALAANVPIMLAYIEALKRDPRVSQAEIITQQPDEKVGPAVIRFRLSVTLNPKITVAHAAREPASAPLATSSAPQGKLVGTQPGILAPLPLVPLAPTAIGRASAPPVPARR